MKLKKKISTSTSNKDNLKGKVKVFEFIEKEYMLPKEYSNYLLKYFEVNPNRELLKPDFSSLLNIIPYNKHDKFRKTLKFFSLNDSWNRCPICNKVFKKIVCISHFNTHLADALGLKKEILNENTRNINIQPIQKKKKVTLSPIKDMSSFVVSSLYFTDSAAIFQGASIIKDDRINENFNQVKKIYTKRYGNISYDSSDNKSFLEFTTNEFIIKMEKLIQSENVNLNKVNANISNKVPSIQWENIIFLNGKIKFLYDKTDYLFNYPESKEFLEYLKDSFKDKNYKYFYYLQNNKPSNIEFDPEIFNQIRDFKIQDEVDFQITEKFNPIPIPDNSSLIIFLKKKRTFKIEYFKELLKLKKNSDPIYFLNENYSVNSNIYYIKNIESLMFTIISSGKTIFVWESINNYNATYLFLAENNNYKIILKRLCSFIHSNIDNKRTIIINNPDDFLNGIIKTKRVYHNNQTTIQSWIEEIKFFISCS